MILVDTSVWVDHLRAGRPTLVDLLERGEALSHPFVVGELALGHLRERRRAIELLDRLPQATVATPFEVLTLIEREELPGAGIGYVDAQLLAATRLTEGAGLWTDDRRLGAVAARLGCAFRPIGAD